MSQNKDAVKQSIADMKATVADLEKEGNLFLEKGNKAAVTRARAAAQNLKKLAQDFRTAIHAAKSEA